MNKIRHIKELSYQNRAIALLVTILLLCLLCQCSVKTDATRVYVVNGKEYGQTEGAFRHKFWNYYERGLSYAEGRFFKEALADFNQAIALRPDD